MGGFNYFPDKSKPPGGQKHDGRISDEEPISLLFDK
jgi:hypothetical protein